MSSVMSQLISEMDPLVPPLASTTLGPYTPSIILSLPFNNTCILTNSFHSVFRAACDDGGAPAVLRLLKRQALITADGSNRFCHYLYHSLKHLEKAGVSGRDASDFLGHLSVKLEDPMRSALKAVYVSALIFFFQLCNVAALHRATYTVHLLLLKVFAKK